jgi:hypothetical protein
MSPARPSGLDDKALSLPDKTAHPLPNSEPSEHQHFLRLDGLEKQLAAFTDELHSCCGVAQDAHDKCCHHQTIMANLSSCLDTAEHLLKSFLASQQQDEAKYKSFVTSVEHALFSPQGQVGALQAQVKSLQNCFDSDGSIACRGVHFASKTEMAACFRGTVTQLEFFVMRLVSCTLFKPLWFIKPKPSSPWRLNKRF